MFVLSYIGMSLLILFFQKEHFDKEMILAITICSLICAFFGWIFEKLTDRF
jgi:uncharacterized membrane protein YfcA